MHNPPPVCLHCALPSRLENNLRSSSRTLPAAEAPNQQIEIYTQHQCQHYAITGLAMPLRCLGSRILLANKERLIRMSPG